ncbi:molybdopterin molybdotransferase MoeA [Sphingomonas pruni]|uniref:molybdopterin molybdotransferase MoeA n=1 Tax=Sphingomonas pruni TaxID=40683 RepID=UPI00082A1028|nr:molybdopterin molybdotransferase MoeA [Sphingomonas pruni]
MNRIDFSAALSCIENVAPTMPVEPVAIDAALGRIIGAGVVAQADYPRFDCSAMDGFAIVAADAANASLDRPVRLDLIGESRAGAAASLVSAPGACAISTGAPIVPPFDAVVAKERVVRDGPAILLTEPVGLGRNIRRRGEDARQGDLVAVRGKLVTPEVIGALCCFGVPEIDAIRLPRVVVLTTGDELRRARGEGEHFVHDSNGPMITAMMRQAGLAPQLVTPAPDDRGALVTSIEQALAAAPDLIISTGGVSVGDHDQVPAALQALGATIHFRGVAMRPGKPVLFASLPNGCLYFGLPGNPVAAAVSARFFVIAAIRAMLGLQRERGWAVAIDAPGGPDNVGTRILKARWHPGPPPAVTLAADQRSHTMRPLLDCNSWVVRSIGPDGDAGWTCFAMTPSFAGG